MRLPPRTRPDSGFPVLPAVDRLDEVTGIGREAAIIAEIGLLMSTFPTAAHLVSWAKLSPRTIQSGAKNRSGKTGKGNHYAFTGSWLGDHMITKSTPPDPRHFLDAARRIAPGSATRVLQAGERLSMTSAATR